MSPVVTIEPPDGPVSGQAHPPGSKSHTIRALFAAASAPGRSTLIGALDSDDTRRARDCLRLLGASVAEDGDIWQVDGVGGRFIDPGRPLDVGESGLTARLVLGLCPFIPGPVVIEGRGRLPERPMGPLLDVLAERGAVLGDGYPWKIDARSARRGGVMTVDAAASSQVVSSLLLAAPHSDVATTITVANLRSSAEYVDMTIEVMRSFGAVVAVDDQRFEVAPSGYQPVVYRVPVDASACVYPAVAAAITGGRVEILGDTGKHPDRRIFDALEEMGCLVQMTPEGTVVSGPETLAPIDIDMSQAPDAAVGLAMACACARGTSRIDGLESLRLKESDRLGALEAELRRAGADVGVDGNALEITGGGLRPGRFRTYNDHRIAMSLALLGLVLGGVEIESPQVVEKTWPGYWEWLRSTGAMVTGN